MTTISADARLDGYPVRTGFRGAIVGYVKATGWRWQWQATCSLCEATVEGDTRTVAAERLGHHYNAEHKPARRVRLLR
jgi:uncharacterized Fe-S cluster-containing MiaB family protein